MQIAEIQHKVGNLLLSLSTIAQNVSFGWTASMDIDPRMLILGLRGHAGKGRSAAGR